MAENVLETKIQLRYGTYSQWMNSNIILMQGEAAICAFPNDRVIDGLSNTTPENTPPAIGIKIGDGTHYFSELPWVQAIAADVYNWAKSAQKPSYGASEIIGLANYIQQYIAEENPGSGSSSSAYRIIYNSNSNKYILQRYDDDSSSWIDTTSEIDVSDILFRLTAIENWANGGGNNLGNINEPLDGIVHDYILVELNKLNYTDNPQEHEFVTSVNENRGKITVSHRAITTSDITGVFDVSQGGTGVTNFTENTLLVGNGSGPIITKPIVNLIESDSTNSIPTAGAVARYVDNATAGLTGAMHFIGEATVAITNGFGGDPRITGYNFLQAQEGDVILSNNAEYVWTGGQWRLLGDEGSYAVKGSITNADISEEAYIAQSKINNLTQDLSSKVDKVDGKGLSSNDYTTEEKNKLATISENANQNIIEHVTLNGNEIIPTNNKTINLQITPFDEESIAKLDSIANNAQVNTIEHIYVNGVPQPIVSIGNVDKIVNLRMVEYTQDEKTKLATIEEEAQVNKIETIKINNTIYTPNDKKEVSITIDQTALDLNVLEGAQIPAVTGANKEEVEQISKKLQLARIAVSGDVKELKQITDTYIILDCGDSTTVI